MGTGQTVHVTVGYVVAKHGGLLFLPPSPLKQQACCPTLGQATSAGTSPGVPHALARHAVRPGTHAGRSPAGTLARPQRGRRVRC